MLSSICIRCTYLSYEAAYTCCPMQARSRGSNKILKIKYIIMVASTSFYIPNFSGYLPFVPAKYRFISGISLSMSPDGMILLVQRINFFS